MSPVRPFASLIASIETFKKKKKNHAHKSIDLLEEKKKNQQTYPVFSRDGPKGISLLNLYRCLGISLLNLHRCSRQWRWLFAARQLSYTQLVRIIKTKWKLGKKGYKTKNRLGIFFLLQLLVPWILDIVVFGWLLLEVKIHNIWICYCCCLTYGLGFWWRSLRCPQTPRTQLHSHSLHR